MPAFVLHGQTSGAGIMSIIGTPLLAGVAALVAATVAMRLFGWRAGLAAVVAGVVLLAGGLAGDLVTHGGQTHEREQLTAALAVRADPDAAARLHQMEEAEASNRWHLLVAAGQVLLLAGLAGTCLMLWLRGRSAGVTDRVAQRLAHNGAWTAPPNPPATEQRPAGVAGGEEPLVLDSGRRAALRP